MNRVIILAALVLLAGLGQSNAQLASWGSYVPRRAKPPVIFITGHDAICPDAKSGETPVFDLTFGDFDELMARDGRISFVFEACYAPNRPPIEDIAEVLGRMLSGLLYEDGEPVREVDVVAHSMGGLVLRAYLAGRRKDGTLAPPESPRVRKAVFIGTPHFGTPVATSLDRDPQVRAMAPGSAFLFELATWNQGRDDLRGVDALSIAGTAGRNGPATDSVVSLGSASLDFVAPGRTAVFPLCHTQGGIGQLFLCDGAPGLAHVSNASDPTAQLVLDFLNDVKPWPLGAQSDTVPAVSERSAGVWVQLRNAENVPQAIRSAKVFYEGGAGLSLDVSSAGIAFGDMLPPGPATLEIDSVQWRIILPAGGTRPLVLKTGPQMHAVRPATGAAWPLVLAPGMLVAITGSQLNAGQPAVTLARKPLPIVASSENEILVVFPEDVVGLHELQLRNAAGRHSLRVLLEPAFPTLFKRSGFVAAVDAVSGAEISPTNPAQPGDIVSIFLTGLGAVHMTDGLAVASLSPTVSIDGRSCEILYAGRAPELAGVDQINCRVPQDLGMGTRSLRVSSGARTSTALISVR